MSFDDVDALADLDRASGWDEDRWDNVLARYWAEYDWIAIDANAQSAKYCLINSSPDFADYIDAGVSETLAERLDATRFWIAQQSIVDPHEDLDWRITALVDVGASDRDSRVVLRLVDVSPMKR